MRVAALNEQARHQALGETEGQRDREIYDRIDGTVGTLILSSRISPASLLVPTVASLGV